MSRAVPHCQSRCLGRFALLNAAPSRAGIGPSGSRPGTLPTPPDSALARPVSSSPCSPCHELTLLGRRESPPPLNSAHTGQSQRLTKQKQQGGLGNDTSDEVRVAVRGRATVLEVTVALRGNVTGDADRSAAVGNTGREVANVAGLVLARETLVVVGTVDGNVLVVALGELLDGSLDGLHAALLAHRVGRVVGVAASTVPVTGDGLGVERDLDAPLLSHADEEVARKGEVVAHLDTLARADLELPLGRHDLGVDARDVDTGVEAGAVVGLDEVTGEDLAGTGTAVVGTLGAGETALGPARPGHDLVALVAVVRLVGGAVVVVALGENNDVVTATEGVGVVGGGAEVDIRVAAGGLVGGGAVKVPLLEVLERLDGAVKGGGLATDLAWRAEKERASTRTVSFVVREAVKMRSVCPQERADRIQAKPEKSGYSPSPSIQMYSAMTLPRWSSSK
ncbi:hypothetical protein L1887_58390 [Cichorium endivia]|nr:hypothetical protein L1887_58390 [Cichorium endivia]